MIAPSSWRTEEVHERAILQVLEVYRRRVDDPQTGIPESVVTRQGRDRVLIQFPGISRVPDIFRKTGHLGLLGHGHRVEFRNLRVKELPSGK